MSKAVNVIDWRSASWAETAPATCAGGCISGLAVVVVLPFSSVEREKTTLPLGWGGFWVAGGTGGVVV
jgi:hypothetical protein